MRAAIFSPHWQGIEHDRRENAGCLCLKENVAGGDWKRTFAMPRSQRRSKHQRVEMAAMIRCQHKRTVRRQLLATDDHKSMRDREVNAQQRKTNVMRKIFEQPAFTADATKPFAWSKTGVVGRLKVPG